MRAHAASELLRGACTGLTGHTEAACQVVYDPSLISFVDLLRWFWECHDPTQGYGQGADRGTQYRSAIVCYDDEQYQLATSSRNAYQNAIKAAQRLNSDAAITVEILPPRQQEAEEMPFYYAEEYHMQYLARPEGSPYRTAEPADDLASAISHMVSDGAARGACATIE